MFAKLLLLWTILSSFSVVFRCQVPQSNPQQSAPLVFEGARECPQGSDKLLSECFKLVQKDYNQWASAGILALKTQSTDPLHLPGTSFRVFGDLMYTWTNISVYGGTKNSEEDQEVDINTKNRTIYLKEVYPSIRVTADYERTGHFLWISLRDTGNLELNITNQRSNVTIFLKIVQQDGGEPVLQVQDIKLQIEVEDVRSHIKNLADSGLWGQLINSFINKNMKWIYKSFIEPGLIERAQEFVSVYWGKILPVTLSVSHFINQ